MTQPVPKPRAVVDTNLFVSGAIFKRGNPHAILTAWRDSAFVLILGTSQHREIADVFSRPKLIDRFRLTAHELADLLAHLDRAPRIEPTAEIRIYVRDPKDEHILAAALDGKADYLVTGDKDLLVLREDQHLDTLKIVTVAEFLAILTESERLDEGRSF